MNIVTRIEPLDDDERAGRVDRSQLVMSAGPTLNSMSANPIAMANEKMIWPRVISVVTSPSSPSS